MCARVCVYVSVNVWVYVRANVCVRLYVCMCVCVYVCMFYMCERVELGCNVARYLAYKLWSRADKHITLFAFFSSGPTCVLNDFTSNRYIKSAFHVLVKVKRSYK